MTFHTHSITPYQTHPKENTGCGPRLVRNISLLASQISNAPLALSLSLAASRNNSYSLIHSSRILKKLRQISEFEAAVAEAEEDVVANICR